MIVSYEHVVLVHVLSRAIVSRIAARLEKFRVRDVCQGVTLARAAGRTMTAGARNPPSCQLSKLTCERVYSSKQPASFSYTISAFPTSHTGLHQAQRVVQRRLFGSPLVR
jgi:hypothetical protein